MSPTMVSKSFAGVIGVLAGLVSLLVIGLWKALALDLLWGWFIEPLGVTDISYWHAYGIVITVGLLAVDTASIKDEYKDNAAVYLKCLIGPALAIVFGGLVKALMG